MITASAGLAFVLFLIGILAGSMGALLGIGGGVFLVPFLVLVLHVPMKIAVGTSLTTVIATSSAVSAGRLGRQLINLRLGMLLEVATTVGGLAAAIVATMLSAQTLQRLFGLVTAASALIMLRRLDRRNVITDPTVNPGRLGGRYHEAESGGEVVYRVKRVPLAMAVSFAAGSVSSLLGIGGGIIKVPAMNAWCGVPLRAAAATSAFMIGVTATAGAVIYYGRGEVIPWVSASTVLGVLVGSRIGLHISSRAKAKWQKMLLVVVLLVVCALMFMRAQ